MRLNKIHIKNFRCFDNLEIELGEEVTIFIGKNGSGKTNLIKAMQKGLSLIFAKHKDFRKSLSDINECEVEQFKLWDTRFNDIERAFVFPTEIEYTAHFDNENINWTFLKKQDPDEIHKELFDAALYKILKKYNEKDDFHLPVICFFSDAFPRSLDKVDEKAADMIEKDKLPREFGYYSWNKDTNCPELWQRRYVKMHNAYQDFRNEMEVTRQKHEILEKEISQTEEYLQKIRKEKKNINQNEIESRKQTLRYHKEQYKKSMEKLESYAEKAHLIDDYAISFIKDRIKKFTEITDKYRLTNEEFEIETILVSRPDSKSNDRITFLFRNAKSTFYDILPQGYKRLLSIVLDISFRSLILNGIKEPKGIVFIDEIELHLHPTLQQDVIDRFKRTFPDIQFIFSTHSPLVISNLKADGTNNKIIKLEHRGTEFTYKTIDNIYGTSYTTSLTEVMESGYRASTIDKLINAYLVLKGKGKDDLAAAVYDRLKEYLDGNVPHLLKTEIEAQLKAYQ